MPKKELQPDIAALEKTLEAAPDKRSRASALAALALALANLDMPRASRLAEEGLALAEAVKDLPATASCLLTLASCNHAQGQWALAVELAERSRTLFSQSGDGLGEARSTQAIGMTLMQLVRYQDALPVLQDGLALYQQQGDRRGEALALSNLGNLYMHLNDAAEAASYLEQSLSLSRQEGDRRVQAGALLGIINLRSLRGDHRAMLEATQESLSLFQAEGNAHGAAVSLAYMGDAYQRLSDYSASLDAFLQALELSRKHKLAYMEGGVLRGIGIIYAELGDQMTAIEYHLKSLELNESLGVINNAAAALESLGNAYGRLGNYSKALLYFQRAIAYAQRVGNRSGEARLLAQVGLVYLRLNQPADALLCYQNGLRLCAEAGDRDGEMRLRQGLGNYHVARHAYAEALTEYARALALAESLSSRDIEQSVHKTLSETHQAMGNDREARRHLQEAEDIKAQIFNSDVARETKRLIVEHEVSEAADNLGAASVAFRKASEQRTEKLLAVAAQPETPVDVRLRAGLAKDRGVYISAFGDLKVWIAGRKIEDKSWQGKKTKAVFKRLLIDYASPVSMDEIADSIWPDATPDKAQNLCMAAISYLRKALEPELKFGKASRYIVNRNGGYALTFDSAPDGTTAWLSVESHIDFMEFRKHISAARNAARDKASSPEALNGALHHYGDAARLYTADFLKEDLYEEWTALMRESLKSDLLEALEFLMQESVVQGNSDAAILNARLILEKDALHEGAYAALIRLYQTQGNAAGLQKLVAQCRAAYRAELGIDLPPRLAKLL